MNTTDILKALNPAEMDAGIIFSGRPTGTKVMGYDKPSPFTPQIDPNYIFHESSRDVIVWLIAPPSPLYVCGVSGVGKSTCTATLYSGIEKQGWHHPRLHTRQPLFLLLVWQRTVLRGRFYGAGRASEAD